MDHKVDVELKNKRGKSIYPKYVTDKNNNRIIVNNPEHEAEVTDKILGKDKKEKEEDKKKDKAPDWN